MTNDEKIDILYRKFATLDRSQESAFNLQVWRDSSSIPSVLPSFDENGIYRNDSNEPILKLVNYARMDKISGTIDAYSSELVSDVVCYESGFDVTYECTFYNKAANGTYIKIPFSSGDRFFDPVTGILFFTSGVKNLFNTNHVYVSCVCYVGKKGLDIKSQFTSHPELGPTGPTGPTGITGDIGEVKLNSMRYKATWNSGVTYSKWEVVKYNDLFYFSTCDFNNNPISNPIYWRPFGVKQLRTNFSYPDSTIFVSPGFDDVDNLASSLENALDLINTFEITNISIIVYPGEYTINNTLTMYSNIELNIVFVGHSSVTFSSSTLGIDFSGNSVVEIRGNDFEFTNGRIGLSESSLKSTNGIFSTIELTTADTSDVGRLLLTDSVVENIQSYSSYVSLNRCCIKGSIVMDELSTIHIDSCYTKSSSSGIEKVVIVDQPTSGVSSTYAMDNPALLIKNSKLVSESADVVSYIGSNSPAYGFKVGIIRSSLYNSDRTGYATRYDEPVDTLFCDVAYNTSYDTLNLISISGNNKYVNSSIPN